MKTMLVVEERVVAWSLCWQERGTWLTSAGLRQAVLQMLTTGNDLIQDVYVFSRLPLASVNHRMTLRIIRESVLHRAAVVQQRASLSSSRYGVLLWLNSRILKYSHITSHDILDFGRQWPDFCCCGSINELCNYQLSSSHNNGDERWKLWFKKIYMFCTFSNRNFV